MGLITPGELKTVSGAADPQTILDDNSTVLSRKIFKSLPTYVAGVPVATSGPPGAAGIDAEVYVDVDLRVYRYNTAGATWILTSEPLIAPTIVIPALDINWRSGSRFRKTLAANSVFTFSNLVNDREIQVLLTNTVANYTVTWPAGILWAGGAAPVQTVGAKTDLYWFVRVNGTIYGRASQNY